jgi:hypothetical protein
MTGDEERMAMLAGEDLDALDPDERVELESWVRLLADPDVWAEPAPGLEDAVVATIQGSPPVSRTWVSSTSRRSSRHSWVRPLLAGLAVAAAIVAAVLLFNGHGKEQFASAALGGTELAPGAHGDASVYKDAAGFRIELKADGLAPFDDGRFYEAWLRSDSGGLIPIGTFSKGNGEMVTLWSGVSPKDYPTLTVTIEKPDGNQASSGQRVLAGKIS